MKSSTNLTIGQFGESEEPIMLILSANDQPLYAMVILRAGYWQSGCRIDLHGDEVRMFADALGGNADYSLIDNETMEFTISTENRGEPYRDGFSLRLSEKESHESTSCWMEERDAEMMLEMLKKRIAAETAPDDLVPM